MIEVTALPKVEDRSAWYATDKTDWIEEISTDQIGEVEAAVRELERIGVESEKVIAEKFSLPKLGPWLQGLLDEVLNGRGFVLIRRLPIERWTRRQAALAFLIVGAQLGN